MKQSQLNLCSLHGYLEIDPRLQETTGDESAFKGEDDSLDDPLTRLNAQFYKDLSGKLIESFSRSLATNPESYVTIDTAFAFPVESSINIHIRQTFTELEPPEEEIIMFPTQSSPDSSCSVTPILSVPLTDHTAMRWLQGMGMRPTKQVIEQGIRCRQHARGVGSLKGGGSSSSSNPISVRVFRALQPPTVPTRNGRLPVGVKKSEFQMPKQPSPLADMLGGFTAQLPPNALQPIGPPRMLYVSLECTSTSEGVKRTSDRLHAVAVANPMVLLGKATVNKL